MAVNTYGMTKIAPCFFKFLSPNFELTQSQGTHERGRVPMRHSQDIVRGISELSPSLPSVLSETFLWTLPSVQVALERNTRDRPDNGPWVLTRISSQWRALSLLTPSLWRLIAIDYEKLQYPSSLQNMINSQIQRAQRLCIHFYGSQHADSRPQIELFALLSQHSSRWEHCNLQLTTKLVPLLSSLRDRLLSLVKLWI
ncbi:hypothetical protein DFH07DRAFT_292334 [Mycena maculata]|uniref:F-box domain-containing protein n=1 Tax=Mycena maculata TaxID=230809 RepID=A0AAD7NPN4_9AGAR|nr:hypothetical protein DFH07DRAFT_292334 [Mycena maculata]